MTPLLKVPNGSGMSEQERECTFFKTIKNAKDKTLEGEMQIINSYLLIL